MPFFGQWGETGAGGGGGAAERFLGAWNATTNTPTITASMGTQGDFYRVSVAGSTNIDGTTTWEVGDRIAFNGTIWQRIPNTGVDTSDINNAIDAVFGTLADNAIPRKQSGNNVLEDSSLDDSGTVLSSNKSLEVPPGSVLIGPTSRLSNALQTLSYRSDVTNETLLVIGQEFNETTGFSTATVYSGSAMTQVNLNDPAGTDTANSAQFSLSSTANQIITQFSVETNQLSQSIAFTLTGRTTSQAGPIAFSFSGTVTTNASGIATVNLIEDFNPIVVDNGDEIFLSATATGLVGVQSGPDFTPNTTVNRIVIQQQRVALFDEIPTVVQSDYGETNPAAPSFILRKPTLPVPRTDEEIRDVIGTALVAGTNITIDVDDAADTITINGTGGGPVPQPGPNDFRYGLSNQSDPALVVFANLTDVATPTDPITVQTGTTSAGDYFHIFSANTHDIQTITDTVLNQIVYQDGASGNIFTKTNDARTESSVTYDAYTVGPLNAGIDESYVVAFT